MRIYFCYGFDGHGNGLIIFDGHGGEDSRSKFMGYLYEALIQKGIATFKDDENLEKGKPIRPELLEAIKESKFAIVILSENYASSTWCLDKASPLFNMSTFMFIKWSSN